MANPLIDIGSSAFTRTYNELLSASSKMISAAAAISFWVNSKGGGRFAPMEGVAAKNLIQSTIDGARPEIAAASGSAPLSEHYLNWKFSSNYSADIWRRTGVLSDSFQVTKSSSGSSSSALLQINPLAETPIFNYDGTVYGSRAVSTVVKWLEEGTVFMPARPLGSAAVRFFVTLYHPRICKAVEAALGKQLHTIQSGEGMERGTGTWVQTLEQLASADVNGDFSVTKVMEALAGRYDHTTEITNSNLQIKQILTSAGFSSDEITKIISELGSL